MTQQDQTSPHRSWSGLHPAVYFALIACAVAMALGAWLFAVGSINYGLVFGVVGVFTLAAVGVPLWLAHCNPDRDPGCGRFRDWAAGDFEIFGGKRVRSREAMAMILIAPLSGAVGLAALALIAIGTAA